MIIIAESLGGECKTCPLSKHSWRFLAFLQQKAKGKFLEKLHSDAVMADFHQTRQLLNASFYYGIFQSWTLVSDDWTWSKALFYVIHEFFSSRDKTFKKKKKKHWFQVIKSHTMDKDNWFRWLKTSTSHWFWPSFRGCSCL